MQSNWDILGLNGATIDLKVIRMAYAAKLKVTRPEEDQAAFMELRQAFENAKNYARYEALNLAQINAQNDPVQASITTSQAQGDDLEGRDRATDLHSTDIEPDRPKPDSPVQILFNKLAALADDPNRREFFGQWNDIIKTRHVLSIDDYNNFDLSFREILLGMHGYFGHDSEDDRNDPMINPPLPLATLKDIIHEMEWLSKGTGNPYIQNEINWIKMRAGERQPRPSRVQIEPEQDSPWRSIWFVLVVLVIGGNIVRIIAEESNPKPKFDYARWQQLKQGSELGNSADYLENIQREIWGDDYEAKKEQQQRLQEMFQKMERGPDGTLRLKSTIEPDGGFVIMEDGKIKPLYKRPQTPEAQLEDAMKTLETSSVLQRIDLSETGPDAPETKLDDPEQPEP